jgi:WS/DGAT/MGAT family acyltransferase
MLKQLSGLDTMFLYLEKTRTPFEVSTLQIYDPSTAPGGKVRFKEILATFESRLDRSKVFKRKLLEVPFSLDHPYWVEDKDFDIEYHVRHISLPKPGDWRQLMIQISRLQSQHLDRSRPLWEVYVIEGLDNVEGLNKGCFGLFMKMHHATIDGFSGQEIQIAIHDLEPVKIDLSEYEPGSSVEPGNPPGSWGLLARSPVNYIKKSTKLIYGVASAAPGLIKAGLAKRNKPSEEVPKTVFNVGRASANRVVDGRFYDLAEMKQISRTIENTTINDVVLTVVSGAMRKYLKSKGHLPEKSLVTSCPINIRRQDGKHDHHDNMVGAMNVSLCSDIADPIERMHAIHEATKESKAMMETMGAGTVTEIPMNLPAPIAKSLLPATMELLSRTGITLFNTLITNVAGIQKPLYLAGAEMVSLMGVLPVIDMMGLLHAVFSYNGRISIAFTACREMLPDPGFYAECIEESYDELKNTVLPVRKLAAAKPGTAQKTRKSPSVKKLKKKRSGKAATRKSPLGGTSLKKASLKKTGAKKTTRKKIARATA